LEALRAAIIELWADPDEADRMGAEGRRTVAERFRLRRFSDGVAEVIADAVAVSR